MLSAHSSNVGSAPDATGIRHSGARLVEENQSTERCHRLQPTLEETACSGKSSQLLKNAGREISRSRSGDARYATRKSPFIA